MGKAINSASLQANGKESITDIFTSFLVGLAILSSYFHLPYVEGVVGLGLAFLIFKLALESGIDALLVLLDAGVPAEVEKKIRKMILSISGVRGLKELRLRRAGPFIFGEATILINRELPLKRIHEITQTIEHTLKQKIKNLDSLVIHPEPYRLEKMRVALPIQEDLGLDSPIADHFGRAPFFILVDLEGKQIRSYKVIKNTAQNLKIHAGLEATKLLLKEKIDVLVVKRVGEISFHTLRDNLVELHATKAKTVLEALKALRQRKTKILSSPTHPSDKTLAK